MKLRHLYLLLLMLVQGQMFAQTAITDQIKKLVPKPIPQSPNVAALGQYGTYSVNLYTGLPEISIPIFDVTSGSLKAPITLSYHAAGIKYTDQATWVGLGWSLSAGGQVSRNTIGKPDEEYYYSSGLGMASVCSNYNYVRNAANGFNDSEADVFSYSYPGKSGNFLLGAHLGTPAAPYYLVPYEPIKLEPEFSATQFHKFKITDESGVAYQFGKNLAGTSVTETTSNDNGGVNTLSRTAWYLMDMTAPNSNDQINFTYQDVGLAYIVDASDRLSVSDLCSGTNVGSCQPEFISVVTETLSVSNVNQKGLDEIFFEGGKVKFILGGRRNDQHVSADLKSLDRIEVYSQLNGVYAIQKTYKFVYSYFKNLANTIDLRLKLDELQVYDKNNQLVQKYQFNYFTNSFSWDVPTNSKRRDYLGYYNNRSNVSLIPTTQIQTQSTSASSPVTTTIGNANRATDTTYLKEGVLKKITFPTGGYTEFAYEPNQYQETGVTQYPGGLRIRRISSYDGISTQPIQKSYKYGDGETGFGIKNFFLSKTFFMNEQKATAYNLAGPNGAINYNYRIRTYLSSSTLSLDSYDGVPVVYPVVTEYNGNFTSHQGKTVYEYDDKSYEPDQAFVVPLVGKSMKDSRHWKRGKLTKKTVYNSTGSIISSAVTSYQSFQNQNKTIGMGAGTYLIMVQQYDNVNVPTCLNEISELVASQEFQVMNYPQSSGAYRELTTTEYLYENGDVNKYVSKTSSSQFDPTYLQLTQSTQSGAGATENMITKIKYPFSYTFTGSETGTALGVKMLKDKNILTTPIEQYSIKQVGSTYSVIGGQVTTFKANPGNINYVSSDVVYLLETSAVIPEASYVTTGVNSSAVTMDSRYKPGINTFQDLNGNMLQVQQTNNHYIGYQWGYNNSLPIAEAQNAQNNKHIINTQVTGTSAITMGGPTPSVVLNRTINVAYAGTVYLKLGVSGNPTFVTYASYSSATLGNASNITLTKNISCGSAPIIATFNNVPVGSHTITITLTTPTGGVSSLGACGQLDFPDNSTSTSGIMEFFYEGFEEGSATGTATPHTGKKYLIGDYTTTFTKPNARTYLIEYWYLSSGVWNYATTTYTNGMVLTNGDAIDNVRIYPTDARMKSYTYEPTLGISSVIDENGTVLSYIYDSFGRLWQVKNEKGGIEKQYSYNYKTY